MKLNKLSFVILLMFLGALAACKASSVDSSSLGNVIVGGSGGNASALILTATSPSIAPLGTTNITARVVDSLGNNVPDGTVVSFSFTPGDQVKASLSAGSAVTAGGTASVTLTATIFSNAIATVNAKAGSATGSIAITITAGVGGGSVAVSAAPSTITVNGTSTITATVRDAGNALLPNASVNFSLSNNTLGLLSLTTAVTNSLGVATTILTGTNQGSVTVTAAVPSLGATSGQTNVTINPVATVPTLTISSTSSSILTFSTTTINVSLSGFTPPDTIVGQTINFSVDNPGVVTLSALSAVTDGSGLASITLTSKGLVTPVKVTASFAGPPVVNAGTTPGTAFTTITIASAPPDNIVLTTNPTPSISVFATATLSAFVTGNSKSVPDGTLVTFILNDTTKGSLSSTIGSTVNGIATTTFVANNNAGSVSLSAVSGSASSPAATLLIAAAQTGSIQFVSATPQVIGIAGTGQASTSTVIWKVLDINGKPVVDGTRTDFTMLGPGGGAYIGANAGQTIATSGTVNGNASVLLHSGTTAGPVTIIASTQSGGVTISSSGSQMSIGGGMPSATHFNLATDVFNLPGLVISNSQANISAYIADRFGNYNVLNGTSISFRTEAGAIDRQGSTDATGKTSVVFRTQAPDPAIVSIWTSTIPVSPNEVDELKLINYLNTTYGLGIVGSAIHPRNGWATILAAVQGEESFLDENGDGLFTRSTSTTTCPAGYTCECDNGAPNTYAGCITSQPDGSSTCSIATTCAAAGGSIPGNSKRSEGFLDLGEPFVDSNDDGCWNDGNGNKNCGGAISAVSATEPLEQFIDANVNGQYDPPNGKWDGPDQDCSVVGCQTSKMIWTSIKLGITGGAKYCAFGPAPLNTNIPYGGSSSYSFMAGDKFTNWMGGGTTLSVGADAGNITGFPKTTVLDGLPFGPTETFFTINAPASCSPTPCVNPPPLPFTISGTATPPPPLAPCTILMHGTFL